ncbi:hypothetical protein AB0L75_25055 [Streptomyces sp. NPDC052101]|uniref:hypothetical protein n=1 Tax=Streptomyces sp. NPDC052101 TaxID=3155763 RepID=UPI00342267CF
MPATRESFYDSVTDITVPASGLEEAELAKVFENTYRHVNIALVNELSRMAHTLGVDVWHTLELAATKPFGFTKFLPGPGVGGRCLPIDPVYLSHHVKARHGQTFRLIELVGAAVRSHMCTKASIPVICGRFQKFFRFREPYDLHGACTRSA